MSSPEFESAVAPYLHDDEAVDVGVVLDGGWLAITSRRCLAYAADEDRLRAVDRAEVVGVERSVTSAEDALARAPRLFVYGLVAVGVGVGTRRVAETLAVDLTGAGTGSVPAVGSVLALVGLFRRGMTALGRVALAVGALLVLGSVALAAYWYRSRRPVVVVETVDATVEVPGTDEEVATAVADLRGALGDRPDPADLLDR
ncbi:MAG: hypothetical protein ABEJ34_05830 [Haloferacaceae archaeon]